MVTFQIGSRTVTVDGEGASDSPFLVRGTGPNASIAAMAEHQMMDHWMGKGNWVPTKTMTMDKPDGGTLAVMTIRTLDESGELIQGDIYFDVSEAFSDESDE